MFNLFNSGTPKEIMEQAKETYQVPAEKPAEEECPYTIGPTSDGRTVLKVTNGYSIMSLTMSEAAVRQMIRMLEATLPEVDNNQVVEQ